MGFLQREITLYLQFLHQKQVVSVKAQDLNLLQVLERVQGLLVPVITKFIQTLDVWRDHHTKPEHSQELPHIDPEDPQ